MSPDSRFRPDKFTSSIPDFVPASPAGVIAVEHVLEHYSTQIAPLTSLWQIGGVSVEDSSTIAANASNFKLETTSGEYILKRNLLTANVSSLDRQLALLEWLGDRELPVPALVRTNIGEMTASNDNDRWYLAKFVPGNYFSGHEDEISSVANEIGRVISTLAERPAELSLHRTRPDYFTDQEHQTFLEVKNLRSEWFSVFGHENAMLLKENWNLFSGCYSDLVKHSGVLNNFRKSTSHIDLHPHNILMKSDKLSAVLDFDACYEIPIELSIGFATAKLMKRVGTRTKQENSNLSITQCADRFLEILGRHLPEAVLDRQALKQFARAETMRRLLSMCNRRILRQKSVWNDMSVHLSGLGEIDEIFR
jgi:hypothetical protein